MDVADAAVRWAGVLRDAWPKGEVEVFVALYAEDASYRGPFGVAEPAREHMRRSLSLGDPGVEVWVGEPLVCADRVAVEWWAVIAFGGAPTTFAATAWLRFDDEGRVVEEHDDWTSTEGHIEPWPGWGTADQQA